MIHNKPPGQFAALDCGALGARDQAGFAEIRMWSDPRGWFALFFARQGDTRT